MEWWAAAGRNLYERFGRLVDYRVPGALRYGGGLASGSGAGGQIQFEILLDNLIVRLSSDCQWRDEPRGRARFSIQRPPLV